MIIRPATPDDADAICAIHNPIITASDLTFTTEIRTPDAVAAQIAKRGPAFLVAEAPDGIAGFATYGPFRSGPGYTATKELSIYLAETARGLGLGPKLIAELENVARQNGIHILVAGMSATNPAAISFHQKLGYVETARMPEAGRKFDRWLDLILMQKTLPPSR